MGYHFLPEELRDDSVERLGINFSVVRRMVARSSCEVMHGGGL
jgi:hypothetical protein